MNTIKQISDYREHLYYSLYEAENEEIRATILILHGMQEHSGRYEEIAESFADKGFAVLTYDHLGHGKTAKNEGELGFFGDKEPARQVVYDAKTMAEYLESLYPNVPHFIFGHSMGSFISRCLLQEISNRFDGAVIVGTGGKIVGAKLGKVYLSVLNAISPRKRSRFVNNAFSKMNNKCFTKDEGATSTSWLSLSKSNQEAFSKDKLNGIPFTNNGFHTLLSLNISATKRHWAKNISKNLPFLFISGASDPIGDFGKGVSKTVELMRKDGFEEIQLKLYPNMRHEILNEDIKEQVYADIMQWMSKLIDRE
ncbi:MAG: alpha/beta fold hydrolase [Bacteroidales bacterium]